MSRREGRDSHSKRLHSRPERAPSPNKSRRDGKQTTERTFSRHSDIDTTDQDQKRRRRLQDALPLEVPPVTETKVKPNITGEGLSSLSRKVDGLPDANKLLSDPKDGSRSRSSFQHNERSSAGHSYQSSGRRSTDNGKWSSLKEHSGDRSGDKVWKHDEFAELETDLVPPARKRPAFREKKVEAQPEVDAGREEGRNFTRGLENKPDRSVPRNDERNLQRGRGDTQRGNYHSRERFGGGGMRARDRFDGRNGERVTYRAGGFQADKWKHDLFDEANRSPSPKKEEDQIAKVEALLAL